jgi:SpoVK/Ycf46/Vps4 family AAA+-type ATPase
MILDKAFNTYVYNNPLPLETPKWSTNASATNWSPGGYGYSSLPSGIYELETPWGSPPYLRKVAFSTDSLLELPDDSSTEVLEHINSFWSKEADFRALNVTYKRGIMLYGPPGSGKSATIYRLASRLERANAIMLMCQNPDEAKAAIEIVKSLEKNRKIVVIFEDIDGIVYRYGDESLTHLLDGGTDVDNVLFIATTNYPERLPARLINRPSRFDVLMKIDMPTAAARKAYIEHLLGSNLLVDIEEYVVKSDGMSIAQLKELIILTQVFEHSIEEAVRKLKNPHQFA